jgi:hypothetical protein
MNRVSAAFAPPSESNVPDWPPPTTPPISIDHDIQVHMQTCPITVSMIVRTYPPSTYPHSYDYGLPVHLKRYLILASQGVDEFAQSRPPSVSLSSSQFWPPSSSPNSLDHGLQVHLYIHSIAVRRCSADYALVPSAARLIVCKHIDTYIDDTCHNMI